MVTHTGMPVPLKGQRFYRGAGFSEKKMARYVDLFGDLTAL
jgi:hypothetical protein